MEELALGSALGLAKTAQDRPRLPKTAQDCLFLPCFVPSSRRNIEEQAKQQLPQEATMAVTHWQTQCCIVGGGLAGMMLGYCWHGRA